MALKILGVGGSMGDNASTTRAVAQGLDLARGFGADVRLLDLRALDLPMFRPDAGPPSAVILEAAEAVAWADAFLLGSPDYHGSMSGALKNFLDYHWQGFAGKLFGYVCSSNEKGLTVMDQMRTAVRQCYGWSLPYGVSLHEREDLDASGDFGPRLQFRLRMMAHDLFTYGTMIRAQFLHDLAADVPDTFAAHYRSR